MNSIDILNAIGDVDDEYVTKAKSKKTSYKTVWITLGSSLAACLVLFIAVPVIFAMTMRASAPALGNASEPGTSMPGESMVGFGDVDIFYVDGDKIGSITKGLHYSPDEIFTAWREANGIGDEVEFVKVRIEDNGEITESNICGVDVIIDEVGDYFVYNLTISKRIEDYYEVKDRDLLLDSLKQTMTGYSSIEFDEYNLILV